ncbi:hypothetical protein [Massilia genomosp. 1]|uniref:Uncharacterized protein n=1 Tax=Massilia genomosp. 1 TaxID=2609280 RepID=A0ABX0MRB3_9BURK|nr:hypothetical protein [Massilia genomosp. 1]NHZ64617.1 hypothetical protein [Massilia genomosp. 1]
MNHQSPLRSKKEPSTLVRPQYSPGLLLNDDDLTLAVDYTRELNRMLFKSLLGCGVICGLVVSAELECGKVVVKVTPGVALDCHGDPVHVPKQADVAIDPSCGVDVPPRLWVLLRRYDKHCAPRAAVCSQDDDDAASVCTRIRDGFEVSVVGTAPECACGCPEPASTANNAFTGATAAAAAAKAANGKAAKLNPAAAGTAATDDSVTKASAVSDPCYRAHYKGECSCCTDDCDCEWIVLARLDQLKAGTWTADHSVRRFIRPILMADPKVIEETTTAPKT